MSDLPDVHEPKPTALDTTFSDANDADFGEDAVTVPAVTVPAAGPVITTSVVGIPLEQGVLVIADSATFDESHWKAPSAGNVQSGWAIDIVGPSAKELANRIQSWPKTELVDGTWRIVTQNDNEARILKDRILDLLQTNVEMKAIVTVAPKDCSITRIRDAARAQGAAGLMLGGAQARQVVGAVAPRHSTAEATITYSDGRAISVLVKIPSPAT